DESLLDEIRSEIAIMKRLNHKHIVKFIEHYQIEGDHEHHIIMQPVAEATFQDILDNIDQHGKDLAICNVLCQWPACLLRALDYVHSRGIRHKDIKPSNILVAQERVYLADFGISNDFHNRTTSKTDGPVGANTARYIAPEIDEASKRGRATDIWALGCVM
ncbi:kinase-like protein, partial [Amniculicola lignicola CBS 123094]